MSCHHKHNPNKKIILCSQKVQGEAVIAYGTPQLGFVIDATDPRNFLVGFGDSQEVVVEDDTIDPIFGNILFRAPRNGVLRNLYFEARFISADPLIFNQLSVETTVFRAQSPGNSGNMLLQRTPVVRTNLSAVTTVTDDTIDNNNVIANRNITDKLTVSAGDVIGLLITIRVDAPTGQSFVRAFDFQAGLVYA